MPRVKAVIFDFGGVFTESPFTAVEAFGEELGLSPARATELIFGSYEHDGDHPWHRLERGEIALDMARQLILEEASTQGIHLDIYELFGRMASRGAGAGVRLPLVERVRRLKEDGYQLAIVTNNVREFADGWRSLLPLDVDTVFDAVVDSSQVGVRKPDPDIFRIALAALGGVAPEEALFLDDYQANVDSARALGLHAILVTPDPHQTIADIDKLLVART